MVSGVAALNRDPDRAGGVRVGPPAATIFVEFSGHAAAPLSSARNSRRVIQSALAILIFWLAMIFASFGLFAPRNGTVIAVLLICALSVAGSLYLIVQMDQPYSGLIKLSSAPLRAAFSELGGQ
jgi:hypothetical protein